ISGLCYCEMSSLVPVAGSAYSYVYTILGELPAAIIGFVLCIDNSISAAAIARAFAAYGERDCFRYDFDLGSSENLWSISLLSFVLCILLGLLLYRGIKQTSTFNNWSTILNMTVILIFIVGGFIFFRSDIWNPTTPEGIVRGSGRVFFAYLGFDVINCLAEETTE
ncbi:cationic amino acid transporter, putative, partial [Perkinsus marinus ATCC 50983]